MRRKAKLFTLFLYISVVHLGAFWIVELSLGAHAGNELGKVMNRAVGGGVSDGDLANQIMLVRENLSKWSKLRFFLSLPMGPIWNHYMHEISMKYIYGPLREREIDSGQVIFRGVVIGAISSIINSVSFTLIVVGLWRLISATITTNRSR